MTAAKQPFTIRKVNQWMQAIHIFVAIYTVKHPQDAPKLTKYVDIVQRLGRQAGDEAALYYDTIVWEWRETSPLDYQWDQLNSEIHGESLAIGLTKSRGAPNPGAFQFKYKSSSASSPLPQNQFFCPHSAPKFPCHSFNNKGYCNRGNCPYTHACQKCGGPHTKKQCQVGKQVVTSTQNTQATQNANLRQSTTTKAPTATKQPNNK